MGLGQIYAQSALIVFLLIRQAWCSARFKLVADDAEAGLDLESGHAMGRAGGVDMKWTKDKPTMPGAYWLRLGAYVSLVKVEPWKDDGVTVHLDGDPVTMQPGDWVVKYIGMEVAEPLRENMGEWAGPLEEPSLSEFESTP